MVEGKKKKKKKTISACMVFTGRRSRVVTTHIHIQLVVMPFVPLCSHSLMDLKHQGSNQRTLCPIVLFRLYVYRRTVHIANVYPFLTPGGEKKKCVVRRWEKGKMEIK